MRISKREFLATLTAAAGSWAATRALGVSAATLPTGSYQRPLRSSLAAAAAGVDRARVDVSSLYEPFKVGNLSLKNRFVLPPMQRGFVRGGTAQPELAEYYGQRIAGGASLVLTEICSVDHPTTKPASVAGEKSFFGYLAHDTKEGWRRCAEAIHAAGGSFFIQLTHRGKTRPGTAESPSVSVSGPTSPTDVHVRAATERDLEEIRDAFVRSALIAKEIGADGVEIQGCHGYFIDEFLWPGANHRTDKYGGGIRNRARFATEVVSAVRNAVGPAFPLSFRVSQIKSMNVDTRNVQSPDELQILIELIEEAGISLLHASASYFDQPEFPGSDLSWAGWVKSFASVPVITVGSVGLDIEAFRTLFNQEETHLLVVPTLRELVRRFERKEFDLVSVGRAQLVDAQWVTKVRSGHYDAIRPVTRESMSFLRSA